MNGLLEVVQGGLWLVLGLGLPLAALALLAGVGTSFLGQATGLSDPAIGSAMRVAAVVLALWWLGGGWASRVREYTAQTWGVLAEIGRAGVPDPPGPLPPAEPTAP